MLSTNVHKVDPTVQEEPTDFIESEWDLLFYFSVKSDVKGR